jgi:hypothetical protein
MKGKTQQRYDHIILAKIEWPDVCFANLAGYKKSNEEKNEIYSDVYQEQFI